MNFIIGFNVSFAVIFIDLSVFYPPFSYVSPLLSCKVFDLFFLNWRKIRKGTNDKRIVCFPSLSLYDKMYQRYITSPKVTESRDRKSVV